MEGKLQLCVALLLHVSLAVQQRVTVMEGGTVNLRCPIRDADRTLADWKNPEGFIMFFNNDKVLQDERYSITKLSRSEFSIRITNVSLKDGGNYTCFHYDHITRETGVEVTVLGRPRMSVTRHEGSSVIKCTSQANLSPPRISWQLSHSPPFSLGGETFHHEGRIFKSESMLRVLSDEKRVTVKCLVRHPARRAQPLMNFVEVGRRSKSPVLTSTTTAAPTTPAQGSAGGHRTTTGWVTHTRTTSGDLLRSTSQSAASPTHDPQTTTATAGSPGPHRTAGTPQHHSTTGHRTTTSRVTHTRTTSGDLLRSTSQSAASPTHDPQTTTATAGSPGPHRTAGPPQHHSTTGWISVNKTTEDLSSLNGTQPNRTGSFDSNPQRGTGGNAPILVFLVTCLIAGLFVVVIFFAIKLRKAHAAWRRENEDTDPSEESSKSKASQEDKMFQGQKRRGLLNTAFAHYVVQEPTGTTSVPKPAALTAPDSTQTDTSSPAPSPPQHPAKADIKETAL